VSAQLFQLLAQLDRPGATELVVATGRQVAVRVGGNYHTLTAAAVSLPQLMHLIRDTPLARLVPDSEEVGDALPIDLDGRPLRAQFIRQGGEVLLRLEVRAAAPATRGATKRAARPSPQPPSPQPPSRPSPMPHSHTHTHGHSHNHSHGPGRTPPHGSAVTVPQVTVTSSVPVIADRAAAGAAAAAAPATTAAAPAPAPPGLIDEPSDIVPQLAKLVAEARGRQATDLHIAANRPVLIRVLGELIPLDPTPRSAADIEAMVLPLLGPVRRAQLADRGYVDLAVDVPGGGRLRTNVSRQQGGLKGAFRLSVAAPPSLAELGLPAAVAKVTEHHQGLVVIAGPSGHGKTTTLAALIDLLNRTDPIHILTVEDPVEIVHPRHAAVVSQREVGRHTASFAAALKASLREDPDVIVIGELRDRETVEIALTAAETGHLVLATMSTPSAAKTIDRLIDMFPPDDQSQVRASLGAALKAIVAQRLLPDAQGTGMVAVVELLVGVLALANLIRDNKLFQLPNLMQRGRAFGMLRLDDSLLELVRAGKLTEEVAVRHADNKKELVAALHPAPPPVEQPRRGLFGRKGGE
jgi:twitching motility protein PilT